MKALPWPALALVAIVAGCAPSASGNSSAPPAATAVAFPIASDPAQATASPSTAPSPAPSAAASDGALDLGRLVGIVPTGRILFGIERGGEGTIATVRVDREGMHQIAAMTDHTMANAAWLSRDEIVFDVATGDHRHLFRMRLGDGSATPMTHDPTTGEEKAGVAADGATLAYEHYVVGSNEDLGIQVASPVDATPHALKPYANPIRGGDTEVALSPDGTMLAFIRVPVWDVPGAGLFVVPAKGGDPRRLTGDDLDAGYPRWSPDGHSILFTKGYHTQRATGPLWVVGVEGGRAHPLTSAGDTGVGHWFEGDWSPNGSQIVFKYYEPGWDHNELRIASADGSDVQTVWIGGHAMTAETPDWGP